MLASLENIFYDVFGLHQYPILNACLDVFDGHAFGFVELFLLAFHHVLHERKDDRQ